VGPRGRGNGQFAAVIVRQVAGAFFDVGILLQNLRYAFRTLRPGDRIFACVVVVILAPGTSAAQLRRPLRAEWVSLRRQSDARI
jgi:hypothetical protein